MTPEPEQDQSPQQSPPPMVVPDYPEGLKQVQHEPRKQGYFLPLSLFLVFLFLGVPTISIYFAMFATSDEEVTRFGGDGKINMNAELHLVMLTSARVSMAEKKFEEAKGFIDTVLLNDPDDATALAMLMELENMRISHELRQQGLLDAPDINEVRHVMLMESAREAMANEKWVDAAVYAKRVSEEDPDNKDAAAIFNNAQQKLAEQNEPER